MTYTDAADRADKSEAKPSDPKRWLDMIERYEKGSLEWKERSEKIIKIYLDQHRSVAAPRRFALLWSNIETLKPAIYARLPVAVVSRRYKDQDPAGRKASEVLERCINTTFDLYGIDDVMQLVRDDRLLTSRGSAWVRYEAQIEEVEPPDEAAASETGEAEPPQVTAEKVVCEYVNWSDFGHSMHRTWPEVTTVWRRVYMTKAKVKARWDEETADKLIYEVRPELVGRSQGSTAASDITEPQAIIYEIWDKPSNTAVWLAKEEKTVLEEGEPPLSFRGFFPCPKPIYGTKASGSLIPTPDYRYYQDQAEEIDDLTQKIADLTSWLRLKGFYAGGPSSEGADAVEELLKLEGNNVLVKVESWAGFAERGGVKGLIEWIPLDVIVVALREAVQTRTQLINDVYQISGISDILRGETDPNETLGAQEIKAQTGSRRQAPTQREIARFARDLAEMVGEVIAEVFQPATIGEMSGFDLTTEPPPELMLQMQQAQMMAQQAGPDGQANPQAMQALQSLQKQMQDIALNKQVIELLRDEKTRSFRIEIETDSTIEPDEQAEKQRRVEFLESVGGFIEKVMPVLQMMPEMGPMAGEMLQFMVRGFRVGRSMEDVIEQTVAKLNQKMANPMPPPPDPRIQIAQVKLQAEQQRAQAAQVDVQTAAQKHGQEMQKAQAEMTANSQKHDMELQKMQVELQIMQAKLDAEMEMKRADMDLKRETHHMDLQSKEADHQLKAQDQEHSHGLAMEAAGVKADAGAADGRNRPAGPITVALKGMTDGNKELAGQLAAVLKAVTEASASRPKRIRGPSGKVYQVE